MKTQIKTITKKGEVLLIGIRCNDECNNGHDSFSITGSLYKKGTTVFCDRNYIMGGCIHDVIIAAMPSLQPFVNLHLSDGDGLPMYAVENGYYHLQGVKGTAAFNHKCTLKRFADYMRISEVEAELWVKKIKSKQQLASWVNSMKPFYKKQADEAKELLKKLIKLSAVKS